MKINRQYQELHTDQNTADWVLKQQVERDICLLYHQLANYSYIMGDLYYGSVFSFAYWDHLAMPFLPPEDQAFIRDGCLVMILAMASQCIDGSGACLGGHVPACLAAVSRLAPADDDTSRLVSIVRRALDLVEKGASEPNDFTDDLVWVHRRYVRRYFEERATDFRENPYFAGDAGNR